MRRRIGMHMLFVLLLTVTMSAHAERVTERQIKSAYLYHFLQFVEWQTAMPAAQDDPFTLCFIGGDSFGNAMPALVARTLKGHPLQIRMITEFEAASDCHVLYVNQSLGKAFDAFVKSTNQQKMLTVSDMPGFAARGGMIGFVTVDSRVRVEINQAAAVKAGLQISAKLIEVAVRHY